MLSSRGQWVHRHRDKVMSLANVVGCGWGVKKAGRRKTEHEGMVVFVRRKVAQHELHSRDVVPLRIEEAPTDVVEIGDIRLLAGPAPLSAPLSGVPASAPARSLRAVGRVADMDRTARWRPARPGISLGHEAVTAGTLGAIVRDKVTGELCVLSNNHVVANGTDGRDGRAEQGDAVLQPGPYDGGNLEQDIIGYLERYVPLHPLFRQPDCPWARAAEQALNFTLRFIAKGYTLRFMREHGEDNFVDCALVKPLRQEDVAPDILGIGPVRGVAEAVVGLGVKKSGRTTAVTSGEVVALGATMNVGLGENTVACFADQIVTSPLAQPGDSGSLVVDAGNRAVGLLFAGSDKATLCNRIGLVCEALGIEF